MRFAPLSVDRLKFYYEKLKDFDVLFNDSISSFEDWISQFVAIRSREDVEPTGLVWQVDDVGILFLTDISDFEATAHVNFWDQRLKGREPLAERMLEYLFRRFGFQRISTEVPLYTVRRSDDGESKYSPVMLFVERLGFVKEGRMRNAAPKNGEWYDVNLYSILRHEVLDGDQN